MNDKLLDFEITDKKSFVEFLKLLREDFLTGKWENDNLADYLESMIAYTEDIQGYYDNTQQSIKANEATWKVFADILIGASIYE